jgi:hypothetical protein
MIDKSDPAYIQWLLMQRDDAVERAILAIYACQTADEQATKTTRHSNGRGFSGADASLGSYYARWILEGKHLSGRHLARARTMSLKYVGQLADIAKNRMASSPSIDQPGA